MLEKGQRLILTGEFGYFFVEGNDVLAPEQSAITDRLEGFQHLLQNGEALMLELIIEAAEGFINGFSGDRCDGAILSGSFVAHEMCIRDSGRTASSDILLFPVPLAGSP